MPNDVKYEQILKLKKIMFLFSRASYLNPYHLLCGLTHCDLYWSLWSSWLCRNFKVFSTGTLSAGVFDINYSNQLSRLFGYVPTFVHSKYWWERFGQDLEKSFYSPLLTNTLMTSNSWICSQLTLCVYRQRRVTVSAALNGLKNRYCLGVLFKFSLYTLDGINPGMKIEYE